MKQQSMNKETINKDKERLLKKETLSELKDKYNQSLRVIKEQEKQLDVYRSVTKNVTSHKIVETKSIKSEATAFIIASDWHLEQEVKSNKINGLNEFNLKIANERVNKFFQNAVRLINISGKDVEIKHIILGLLGDFISGNIHDELLEINQLQPMEAVLLVQGYIIGGIEYFLKNTTCDIVVPCVFGNHGRITKKTHVSTEAGNSLEFLMYSNLAQHFKGSERVTIIVSESPICYINVYDYKIRLMHGHYTKYKDGIGGFTIPLNKYISKQDSKIKADLTILGHWHTMFDANSFLVNGSLIGYDSYADALGCRFETPRQVFFLLDKKRGKTIVAPILLD